MSVAEELVEVKKLLMKETQSRKAAEEELNNLKSQVAQWKRSEVSFMPNVFLIQLSSPFVTVLQAIFSHMWYCYI